MRPAVAQGFAAFTERFEGRTDWLYLDVKGLVTIGLGNLVDPMAFALTLPFEKVPSGAAASPAEITAAWCVVKQAQGRKLRGGGAFESLTNIRLTEAGLQALVTQKLTALETQLEFFFGAWGEWPAKTQLATLSMAWAMGGHFPATWPLFVAACDAKDWATAAANCHIRDDDNPGLRPRNTANARLFNDAANPYDDPESLT